MSQSHTVLALPTSTRPSVALPPFACTSINEGLGATWLWASGDLDMASAPRLTEVLRDALRTPHLVILDLREVSFLDSAGMHAIVDASVAARCNGRRLLVVPGLARIQRLFTLTGTSGDIDVLNLDPEEQPVEMFIQRSRRSMATL